MSMSVLSWRRYRGQLVTAGVGLVVVLNLALFSGLVWQHGPAEPGPAEPGPSEPAQRGNTRSIVDEHQPAAAGRIRSDIQGPEGPHPHPRVDAYADTLSIETSHMTLQLQQQRTATRRLLRWKGISAKLPAGSAQLPVLPPLFSARGLLENDLEGRLSSDDCDVVELRGPHSARFDTENQQWDDPVLQQFSGDHLHDRDNTRGHSLQSRMQSITAKLSCLENQLTVLWRVEAVEGQAFARTRLRFHSAGSRHFNNMRYLLALQVDAVGARRSGSVPGSPLLHGHHFYFSIEHPLALNGALREENIAVTAMGALPSLAAGTWSRSYTTVIGTFRSQRDLNRGFMSYLDAVRAAPAQPFLHYNSWFDFYSWQEEDARFGDRSMNERSCTQRVQVIGQELVQKRHVQLDSFLWDDGWDNHSSLWDFHDGFPKGFTPIKQQAQTFGSGIGVWVSPWGGYGSAKKARLANGALHGYEVNEEGFDLSGHNYFHRFAGLTNDMVARYGVNMFKFDGISFGQEENPALYVSEVEALMRLLVGLRKRAKDRLWINLTTGMWPSPFWLLYGDSIWRGHGDLGYHGPGRPRQRWTTFRDAVVQRFVVSRAQLFPLSALMLHGIVAGAVGESRAARLNQLEEEPSSDFEDEVWSYFCTGVMLQELYISPDVMTEAAWDVVATAAKWARSRSAILRHSRWVGGDPVELQTYGFSAVHDGAFIVSLRNPNTESSPVRFTIAALLGVQDQAEIASPKKQAAELSCVYATKGQNCLQTISRMGFDESVCNNDLKCFLSYTQSYQVVVAPLSVVVFEGRFAAS